MTKSHKTVDFFPKRSPFSLFQAEERAKSQSNHCLLNLDHLNTSDDKTSLNEYHAYLSVKLIFLLQEEKTNFLRDLRQRMSVV